MKKSNLGRRGFIKSVALTSLPLVLGKFPLYATSSPKNSTFDENNDKILVLIQLQGGNDGLSTIYHAAQYRNLQAVRGNIIVPENSIINFHNEYGFHPSMQGIKDVWDMDCLGIVQNVGYPNQNRSHFRSTDIWNTASSAEEFEKTGWIGRFYDLDYSDYPTGYPNTKKPHPFALTMGKIVSETCEGVNANYSLSLLDPFNPGTVLAGAGGNVPNNCYGDALIFVNDTVAQTNAYASVITAAANAGNNLSAKWNNLQTELSKKLKNVARLISGGLKTKIYVVQLAGFDTHDRQVIDTDTKTGIQSDLLKELSDAICAFQDDLNLLNISNKVVGMTYSEFGRRIRSNAALGTDHGTAAPLFLFGSCVDKKILGDHPIIDTQIGFDEGVPMQYDFRDIYGTILQNWLGLESNEVSSVLHPNIKLLPLFKTACVTGSPTNTNSFDFKIYPNPATSFIKIELPVLSGITIVSLFDGKGARLKSTEYNNDTSPVQNINWSIDELPSGSYFILVDNPAIRKTKKIIKL
jgi:uncharacterized protein (DUF1501 family)